MQVHRSNRTESLVDSLAAVVQTPVGRWNDPQWIAVQGRGMERWLAQQLADRLGVWACPGFLFPAELMETLLPRSPDQNADHSVYRPDALRLAIHGLLPELLDHEVFTPLRRYLEAQQGSSDARLALADRIARTFDRYLVFRPDLILHWNGRRPAQSKPVAAHPHAAWQRMLWRALEERLGSDHLAGRVATALEETPGWSSAPQRVCLFAFSSLPPLYLDLLTAASPHTELHLFVVSPSPDWFADSVTSSTLFLSAESATAASPSADDTHPLVDSLGRLGRDFLNSLAERDHDISGSERFAVPSGVTALKLLQRDIFELRLRTGASPARGDRSITVHACHGPIREAEVLRDQLRCAFDELPDLMPEEVCILSPDMRFYRPFLEATLPAQSLLPFAVAETTERRDSAMEHAFCALLDLLDGRAGVRDVMEFLSLPPVMAHLDIDPSDLPRVRDRLIGAEVHWGWDGQHREAQGHPGHEKNSWRAGLDRIVLGFAVREPQPLGSLTPLPMTSRDDVEVWNRVLPLLNSLQRIGRSATGKAPLNAWAARLIKASRECLSPAHSGDARYGSSLERLCRILEEMRIDAERAPSTSEPEDVPFSTAKSEVTYRLLQHQRTPLAYGSGISLSQLVPMRAIPFRVVALVGMTEEKFPRREVPSGFDLIAAQPRRGDRTARHDDRQLFLELLLATRDRLIITYPGQSQTEHKSTPPSSVVTDLLRVMGHMFDHAPEVERHLHQNHGLQGSAARYFSASGDAFSYDPVAFSAAQQLAATKAAEAPFHDIDTVSTEPDPGENAHRAKHRVGLQSLIDFFRDPIRAYCRNLGFDLRTSDQTLTSADATELDGLTQWKAQQAILEGGADGKSAAEVLRVLEGSGTLPAGALGNHLRERLLALGQQLVTASGPLFAVPFRPPVEVDLELGPFHLVGRLTGVGPDGLLAAQPGNIQGKGELSFWIRHLALLLSDPGAFRQSTLLGRAAASSPMRPASFESVSFGEVENPGALLHQLLQLHKAGLWRPLPFFPATSRRYMNHRRSKSPEESLWRVELEFNSSRRRGNGEAADPNADRVFWPPNPFRSSPSPVPSGWLSFEACAEVVFEPILRHGVTHTEDNGTPS